MDIHNSWTNVKKLRNGYKWQAFFLDHEVYDEGIAESEEEADKFAAHHTLDIGEMDYFDNTLKMLDYLKKKYEDKGEVYSLFNVNEAIERLKRIRDELGVQEIAQKRR